MGKKVLVNLRFSTRKRISPESIRSLGVGPQKVRQTSSRLKKFEECLFEGAPIY